MNSLLAVDANGNGIELCFEWTSDRYSHAIYEVRTGIRGEVLCRSVESDSLQLWPASPPIQQLSIEAIEDRPTALGVGATGGGHWSISVQAAEQGGKLGLLFDVALRRKGTVEQCGSTYGTIGSRLCIEGFSTIAATEVRDTGSGCEIIPSDLNDAEPPSANTPKIKATIRWAYFMSLTNTC